MLDLGYSDGLSVISLFEQRGNLAATLAGWQKITLAGHVVYAAEPDQRSLTWSSHGMVYTLLADAPAQTVDEVVGDAAARCAARLLEADVTRHGPAGVVGQPVRLRCILSMPPAVYSGHARA